MVLSQPSLIGRLRAGGQAACQYKRQCYQFIKGDSST
jgi:hypothetical protein